MLKKLVALVVLLGICSWARADYFEPDRVYEVGITTVSVNRILVSSSVATQMDNPAMPERVTLDIQNLDATANLFCDTNSGAVATGKGIKITPNNHYIISMLDKSSVLLNQSTGLKQTLDVYCINDSASITSTGTVVQIH